MHTAKRISEISPSVTLAIAAQSKVLKAQGKDIISLSAGEPDFDTPTSIKEAAKKALDEGFTKYTDVSGIPELKKAIIQKIYKEKKISYEPSEVIVTCGAKQALYNFFQATLNRGDEVIIPSPYWVSYPDMIKLAEGIPKTLETSEEERFKVTPTQLKKALTPKTKAFVLVSPSNPTGVLYSEKDLKSLIPILKDKNIFIVYDDIYETLVFDNLKVPHILEIDPSLKNSLLHVSGVSKSFSMTGWRLGWACGPKEIIHAMNTIQSQSTSNPNSIAQKAALYGLTHEIKELSLMKEKFEERRNFVCQKLSQIKNISFVKPDGAFYVFINITAYSHDSVQFSKHLLEKVGLAVVPGSAFGMEGYIRISFATSLEELEEALTRFGKALKSYE